MDVLTQDIDARELEDIDALENRVGGKFLDAALHGDGTGTARFIPVASREFYVDVWNCSGTVVVNGEYVTEDLFDFDHELHDDLVTQVVENDNDGALNWSGQYHPRTEESLKLFRDFMDTVERNPWKTVEKLRAELEYVEKKRSEAKDRVERFSNLLHRFVVAFGRGVSLNEIDRLARDASDELRKNSAIPDARDLYSEWRSHPDQPRLNDYVEVDGTEGHVKGHRCYPDESVSDLTLETGDGETVEMERVKHSDIKYITKRA